MAELQGRRVVVTGGTGVLGTAVVEALLARGATVEVPAVDAREVDAFRLGGHADVTVTPGVDLTDEPAVEAFYAGLPSLWASVHVAGGFVAGPLLETRAADLRRMLELNAVTAFLCSREAVRRIRATGAPEGGRLVNVAARPALVPSGGLAAYAASKAAVATLTLSLAEELAPEGIWVNAVVPSVMDTPANRRAMPYADATQWPSVAHVAETIAFLASTQNAATRGALVPVYGRS